MAKQIEARVPVLIFREGNKVIAYSPALDLSTCGDTEQQARKRFAEAVAIFFEEIIEMGTLEDVLQEYGWYRMPDQDKWCPPVYESSEELIKIPVGA